MLFNPMISTQNGVLTPQSTASALYVAPAASQGHYWHDAGRVTWYGYGFYNNRTACGQRLTPTLIGVAHRTLPCGSLVKFKWHNKVLVVPVVDRGPYPCGYGHSCSLNRVYRWDWTAGTAKYFGGHYTRTGVKYHIVRRGNGKG
jgi:hypothetical protein